jgi:hypothetical protein
MSNMERSALGNMPIWIQRCRKAMDLIERNHGNNNDYYQVRMLADYMDRVVSI